MQSAEQSVGIRQIDNFALGLLASGIEGITDLIELPTAVREISKAITQGSINLNDLTKAIGSSATEPIKYLIKQSQNVWLGKPTDAEVYQYAKHLGNIIQMAYGNGGKALSMISKASPGLMKIVSKGAGKTGIIEQHHLLPQQFKNQFQKAGLDIEKYKIPLDKADHRLKPDGLHTGSNNWYKQWSNFFGQYPNATKPEILNQLDKMQKAAGLK